MNARPARIHISAESTPHGYRRRLTHAEESCGTAEEINRFTARRDRIECETDPCADAMHERTGNTPPSVGRMSTIAVHSSPVAGRMCNIIDRTSLLAARISTTPEAM